MTKDRDDNDTSGRKPLAPVVRNSLKSGLITQGAVSENDRPRTSVMESVNFDFDSIGSATLRSGLTSIGTGLAGNILGMHYFVDTVNSTNTRLIVANGSAVWYLNGSAFATIRTSLTSGSKARFTTYLNFVFMVNGTEATAVWNGDPSGAGFITTGNAASAPTGTLIENFKARIWITGNTTYPDRVYYSSVPTSVATPVVTWNTDVATGQWIDISPSDGDKNTAIKRYRNVLLCFKTNRLYRIFDIGQVDPEPYYAVGTSSNESVVETKAGVFFHHATGFYQYNVYGIVQEISRPVIDFVNAIPASAYASVVGVLDKLGDRITWSIGTVTVRGVTYTNCALRYTISTQVWTHRVYSKPFLASIRQQPYYTDGTTQFPLVGDNAGHIFKLDTGLTDDGTPIAYSLIHGWDNIDGLLSTRKTVMTANFLHYGGSNSTVAYQTEMNDPDTLNDWSKVFSGTFETINTGFNSVNIKGRKIRFRISGQSTGQPFVYNGYELLDVVNEFIQF